MTGHLLTSNNVSSSPVIQFFLSIREQLWIGVTLFFSLSGFLITGILYDTIGTEHYFRVFYGRRVLRIFPLYYGFLLLLTVLTPVLHLDWQGQAYRLWTYTPNIPGLQDWSANPAPFIALQHFWSLAVEEQFYLIWPLLIFWLHGWRKIMVATIVGSAISLGLRTTLAVKGIYPQNHSLPFCMDALLLGGGLALLVRSRYKQVVLRWGAWVALVGLGGTLLQGLRDPNFNWGSSFYLTTLGMTIVALGTTGLVAGALRDESLTQKFFSIRGLRFLGKYSYGLYVYHYTVDAAVTQRLRGWLEAHGMSKVIAILTAAVPVALISVGLAVLSFQLYEKHFLEMKRYFPYGKKVVTEELAHE
jgi:peptidoglycan/LPS O-acetylase OafA/YrhL